jgi:hypothetical protein
MALPRSVIAFAIMLPFSVIVQGQSSDSQQQIPPAQTDQNPKLLERPPLSTPTDRPATENVTPRQIQLALPSGTPIRIALTQRVRIAREGTPVEGKVTDTVYAFDQPVIPAGAEVRGHVARVAPVSKTRRTLAFADADFTPAHQYAITFDTIIMNDGRKIPVTTTASRGTPNVIHLVSDPSRAAKKRNMVSQAAASAKHQVSDTFHQTMQQIKSPGRMQRIKQYALAQLPYRRQYVEPGTRFNADLEAPVNFGSETRIPEQLGSIGTEPAPDTTLHARLAAEVSSATASKGTPIEAFITEPVYNANHQLVLPANSRIVGEVTQAKPARKLHHNGELRVVFERIETPEGKTQAMHGSLEGVEVDSASNMKLDSEGGAHTTDSKSRYFSTGLSLVVAAAASHPESDNGAPDGVADPGTRTVAGGSGFKLVGAVVSLASNSKVFSSALGFYGAGMSVYTHFLSRGKDVVLPKDTPVEITFSDPGHPVDHH